MINGGDWRSQTAGVAFEFRDRSNWSARDLRLLRAHAKIDGMSERETTMPKDYVSLYRRAFEEFGASALWSSRPVPEPTPDDALAITRSLRVEGNLQARWLAEQIEQACRAAH
jgi:hypothetical protein